MNLPPPRGVSGWGAFSTAKPGVKICPLEMVKSCDMLSTEAVDLLLAHPDFYFRLQRRAINREIERE